MEERVCVCVEGERSREALIVWQLRLVRVVVDVDLRRPLEVEEGLEGIRVVDVSVVGVD